MRERVAQFWMVYDFTYCPTRCHNSYQAALEEARRLARKSPEKQFVVLESVRVVRTQDNPLIEYETFSNDQVVGCHTPAQNGGAA